MAVWVLTKIHSFCPHTNNEGHLSIFNDFFHQINLIRLAQRFSLSVFNEMDNPIAQGCGQSHQRPSLIQEENEHTELRKRATFLLNDLLLSIEHQN
jgi:hypothetical protein